MAERPIRTPLNVTVVPTDDPHRFTTLSEFADGDVGIGSIEMVEVEVEEPE